MACSSQSILINAVFLIQISITPQLNSIPQSNKLQGPVLHTLIINLQDHDVHLESIQATLIKRYRSIGLILHCSVASQRSHQYTQLAALQISISVSILRIVKMYTNLLIHFLSDTGNITNPSDTAVLLSLGVVSMMSMVVSMMSWIIHADHFGMSICLICDCLLYNVKEQSQRAYI